MSHKLQLSTFWILVGLAGLGFIRSTSLSALEVVAYSPNGKLLASLVRDYNQPSTPGGWPDFVYVWDPATGKVIYSVFAEQRKVNTIAFSPDSQLLAFGNGPLVSILDAASGEYLKSLDHGIWVTVQSLTFSADGLTLFSAGTNGLISEWRLFSGELLRKWEAHRPRGVNSIAISPDGQALLSGGAEGNLILWNLLSGEKEKELPGSDHEDGVQSVAFSPTGQLFASGEAGGRVKLWDALTADLSHFTEGYLVNFSPDGRTLATYGRDSTVKIGSALTGRLLFTISPRGLTHTLAFSPDGRTLTSNTSGLLEHWTSDTGILIATSIVSDEKFLTYTPEGYFVTSKDEGVINLTLEGKKHELDVNGPLRRPALVEAKLARQPLEAPDFSPNLRWLEPFETTDSADSKIVLAYQGSSPLEELVVSLNNKPIFLEAQGESRIEIPLSLVERENRLVAIARDNNGNSSEPIQLSFKFAEGTFREAFDLEFSEPLPSDLQEADEILLNRVTVPIAATAEQSSRVLRLLGGIDLLRAGVNRLKTKLGQYRYWLEDGKLHRLPEPYERNYAVLVAIDDYKRVRKVGGISANFADLQDMVARAEELKEVLVEHGFPRENISTLYDQQATSQKITQELQRFWTGEEHSGVDRLFFYFGGHGSTLDGRGHLITYDYDANRPGTTSFRMSDIVHSQFPYSDAKHFLVAIDSCSSGLAIPGARTLDGDVESRLKTFRKLSMIQGETKENARNLLVAGTENEKALYINGGIFTKTLIDGLKGEADWNKDGIIQFEELTAHLRNEVRAEARATGVQQVPASFVASTMGSGRVLFFVPQETD